MGTPLTEEPLDRYVNRRLAAPVARVLVPTPVTANQVTLLAAACGIAAGVFLVLGSRSARIAALGFCWAAFILDCADGQLARARGGGSTYGYLIDGAADYVIAIAVHVGFIFVALSEPSLASLPAWATVLICVACGAVMALHSNAFEAVKFRYRADLGEDPGWHLKKQSEILASLENERGPVAAVARAALRAYRLGQVKLNEKAGRGQPITAGTFLLATSLGPTIRLFVLVVSVVAASWWSPAIWTYPVYALFVSTGAWLILEVEGAI